MAGLARAPPKIGPKMLPTCHTSGKVAKAIGCNDFCGTISATVVRRMPTLPLLAPEAALAIIHHVRLFEKPKNRLELMAENMASMMMGFRP